MVQVQRQLFTVADYHKMGEVGILSPDDRVELINGEIIRMSPVRSPHANCVSVLEELLFEQLIGKVTIRTQNPIAISDSSEPEPDVAVVKYGRRRYSKKYPTSQDVLLIVEVSDSTLKYDRTTKLELYASVGIPEYWIMNIPDGQIEVFRKPGNGDYSEKLVFKNDEDVRALSINFKINVEDIFFD
ncbi:MAG: Uma2 family endonuclease [Bacteroidota bacterium]